MKLKNYVNKTKKWGNNFLKELRHYKHRGIGEVKNKYFDADEDIDDHTRDMLNEKLDYITKVAFLLSYI